MLDLGLLAFTQPWLLATALALPALWLLLRVVPPAPRRQGFPALRLLLQLQSSRQTPARTPWWLLLLRLLIAALLILAFAGPLLNPAPQLAGRGPLLLVVDDGWAAAARWQERLAALDALLHQAEREKREVLMLRTAPPPEGSTALVRTTAAAAREALAGFRAHPWPVDRAAALAALDGLSGELVPVWLSDGLATSAAARAAAEQLAGRLRELGPLRVLAEAPGELAPLLLEPDEAGDAFTMRAMRAAPGPAEARAFRALGPAGEVLASGSLELPEGERTGSTALGLPLDLRNRIARLELVPHQGAGGVVLLDERWRRRTVGLLGPQHAVEDQPLLAELYYLQKAFAPFAEVRTAPLDLLLATPLSLLVMTDTGRLPPAERQRIEAWMEEGGVVLRFAGPRLAASEDALVPVRLRAGDRSLGGALSWSEPLALAPFPAGSPFAGLEPSPEARVSRQVLAQPGPALREATLASLADGTPIVTARRQGHGWLILVHTTANTAWTTLPLSGLYVDMLRRVLALAPGAGGTRKGMLEARAVLDAQGLLGDPPRRLQPVPASSFDALVPAPAHPPGLYGPVRASREEESGQARVALNLQAGIDELIPLATEAFGVAPERYTRARELDLAPWLLLAAFILALLDLVLGYLLRGLVPRLGRAAAAVALAGLAVPGLAQAQETADTALANETRLAYVRTGLARVDELSHAGLAGLGRVLGMRSSVDTGEPVPVDPAADELALFPLLYWPVPPEHPNLAEGAIERVDRYLRNGGMILFDTGDASSLLPGQQGGGPGELRLAALLEGLDLPPLLPVPPDHVLTRSFYLLQEFPGRWAGQPVWIDQVPPSINDGVSSVIIGAHDWAAAWAEDEYGRSLLPVVPGGERQRETARRFGVNLVMYALTGNYKTDQVHVPALLERLGQ
ncbi:DUF4159 domain-containing protein [Marinimicrococcus flavescens]|uniref:DUF4159 domain-containing protein n=1 Tax=Marinimicrococcus flavescens TaxID=3031815 RepID=A0AAP3XRN0_9PROT|nr:DUF4159 domain-containing protein [Marinimicrococcus flavescens]